MVDGRVKTKLMSYLAVKKKLEETQNDEAMADINMLFEELTLAAKSNQDDFDAFHKWFMSTAFEDKWTHEVEKFGL